jgi:hypothetical protein
MSNKNAILRSSLQWVGGGGGVSKSPEGGGTDTINATYREAEPDSQIGVPDTQASGTEYDIPFGSIAAASLLQIENQTGQTIKARVNAPPSASAALVSGTKDITLANAVGDLLMVALVTSGGTPGVLSVKRKSDTEVTVQSWLSGTGIQTLDTSTVKVYNLTDLYPLQLPDQAKLIVAMAAVPSAGKVTSASVKTTATQSGAGTVVGRVFGDPV